MANLFYPKFKEVLFAAGANLSSGVVRAVLIDTGTYTYNAAHNAYDDLSGVVGTESPAFTTKTFTNGVFDADNITFTAVSGATVEAIVVFLDTGTPANDLLIAYIDSASSGLPVTPNGGDIVIAWNGSGIGTL
jgi:hypothetical protein